MTAIGPSDTTAVDGGMIVKGTTDKKITWKGTDAGVTYNQWVSSEHFDLANGKNLSLNNINIADPTNRTIGPRNGGGVQEINLSGGGLAYTLGSAVTGSSLTSVGTLTALTVSGQVGVNQSSVNGSRQMEITQPAAFTSGLRINSAGSSGNGAYFEVFVGSANYKWGGDHLTNALLFKKDGTEYLRHSSSGDVLPGSDDAQDLGSSTKRWANIYSADLQLSNEGKTNDVDGTWGSYTIQEGEDDLFLINRRSGKKYKFMLQEVQ